MTGGAVVIGSVARGVVQPVARTPAQWRAQRQRRNALAADAVDHGVWLVGSPEIYDGA